MEISPIKKEEEELSKLVQNRFAIDQFKKDLKAKMRQDPQGDYIALFVLLVAELEFRLKGVLVYYHQSRRYYDDETLGLSRVINQFENVVKGFNKNDLKAYWVKLLYESQNYNAFLKCCRTINELRNDLYHNLFKVEEKAQNKDLKEIIEKIKKHTELYNASHINKDLLYRLSHNENCIPPQWSLELLVEISKIYLRVAMGDKDVI